MTQIKPPTGPGNVNNVNNVDGTLPPENAQSQDASVTSTQNATGPSLGELVEAAEQRAMPAEVGAPANSLTEQIKTGALTRAQAVDQMVERALTDVDSVLSAEQRQDLEETMRSALANDPTLIALQNDLGK